MTPAVGVQLHCGFLSSLFMQATFECLVNTYGSPSTGLAQCITLTCSRQKPLHFSPGMRLADHSLSSLLEDVCFYPYYTELSSQDGATGRRKKAVILPVVERTMQHRHVAGQRGDTGLLIWI